MKENLNTMTHVSFNFILKNFKKLKTDKTFKMPICPSTNIGTKLRAVKLTLLVCVTVHYHSSIPFQSHILLFKIINNDQDEFTFNNPNYIISQGAATF